MESVINALREVGTHTWPMRHGGKGGAGHMARGTCKGELGRGGVLLCHEHEREHARQRAG